MNIRTSSPFSAALEKFRGIRYQQDAWARAVLAVSVRRKTEESRKTWTLHLMRKFASSWCVQQGLHAPDIFPHLFKPVLITVPLLTWDGTKNV